MKSKINKKFRQFNQNLKQFNNVLKRKLLNRKPKINKPLPEIPSLPLQIETQIIPLTLPPPILELSPLLLPKFPYQTLSSKIQRAQRVKLIKVNSPKPSKVEEDYKRPMINSIYTNSCKSHDTCDTCDTCVNCELCFYKNTKNTKNTKMHWDNNNNIISWIETSEDDIMFSNFFTPLSPIDKFDEMEFFQSYK
jgi:hypothetical protein